MKLLLALSEIPTEKFSYLSPWNKVGLHNWKQCLHSMWGRGVLWSCVGQVEFHLMSDHLQ
jgi:hypothetical protein